MPDKTQENPLTSRPLRAAAGRTGDSNGDDDEQPTTGIVSGLGLPGRGTRASGLGRAPISPINADRPVFTLSVAADLLGMHPRTLRIYEEEGLVVPARTETKRRRYSQNDIKRFQFIQHLTQRLRVNLAGVRIILEMMQALENCGVDYTNRLYEMAEQLEGDDREI